MTPDQEIPEREQRVADLLTQASVRTRAPDGLRTRVDALRERPAKRRATRPAVTPSRRLAFRGSGALIAAAFLLVLAFSTHSKTAPSLAKVAALSGLGPAGPAPGPLPSASTTLLTAAVGKLHFPNWQSDGGWRSIGERTDTVGGRTVKTVFYRHGDTRLAYSIVASPVVSGSPAASNSYTVVRNGSRVTVIWTDRGHTCTLTGAGSNAESLWSLAKTTLE
jgi:hypothetical protein